MQGCSLNPGWGTKTPCALWHRKNFFNFKIMISLKKKDKEIFSVPILNNHSVSQYPVTSLLPDTKVCIFTILFLSLLFHSISVHIHEPVPQCLNYYSISDTIVISEKNSLFKVLIFTLLYWIISLGQEFDPFSWILLSPPLSWLQLEIVRLRSSKKFIHSYILYLGLETLTWGLK